MEKASDDEGAPVDDTPPDDRSEEGSDFVEVDPTGRYGRYNEVLGKGAYKTVYKAFDEIDGIEVAWNQVKIYDVLHCAGDIERLYSELHLLKTLKHKNIIKFYNSWVDSRSRNVNFITEIFTSGTLRQYRKKHKNVKLKAIKNWSRQILRGLVFLHSREPPILHRDLKCDNIFINGNTGEVKIGDLGLATILRQAPAAQSVIGTPEFMAPELYEEHYNELVDIYSFGMCLLEMLTSEYPYSECSNAAQIYKKVTTGKKPAALGKIKDPETREFVEKCLASASQRLHARELLMDPFLRSEDDVEMHDTGLHSQGVVRSLGTIPENAYLRSADSFFSTQRLDEVSVRNPSRDEGSPRLNTSLSGRLSVLDPLSPKEGMKSSKDFRIKGRKQDDKKVLVRIRIASPGGEVRVIQFDFDVDADTAMSVASEMVAELDLSDQDVTTIADMIDAEIMGLIPDWRPGLALDEAVDNDVGKDQKAPVVESPLIEDARDDGLSIGTPDTTVGPSDDLQLASGPTYGRFEEVGCNVNGSDEQQQESDGLAFSDFSSEQCESAGSVASLDGQSSYEIGVDNDLTMRSLEGVETGARSGSLPSLDGRPPIEGTDAKEEHVMALGSDETLDDSEMLRLIMQQQEELQVLRSKHEEAIFDLKMRLNNDATDSKVLVLPKVSWLSEITGEVLEISGSIEGFHKDSKSEVNLQGAEAVSDCNSMSHGPSAVFDTAKGVSLALLAQDNIPLTDAMPMLDSTRESHGTVVSETCASIPEEPLRVLDGSPSLHVVEDTPVLPAPVITGEESNGAPADAAVAGSAETKLKVISDKGTQVFKATRELIGTEARSTPSNHEDIKPSTATLVKRESYLELYKASNSKDKVSSSKSSESLGTMDGTAKVSIPKDANQEQLKKIADFAVKNIENLSQSKNKYLVNSSLKSIALQSGQQSGTAKNHGGATIPTGQQCAAAKNVPGATIQNGPRGVAVGNLAGAVVRNGPQCVVKSTASTAIQNSQQGRA